MAFSAGLGVLKMAVEAVSRMAGNSETVAKNQFFLLDKDVWFYNFSIFIFVLLMPSYVYFLYNMMTGLSRCLAMIM